MARGGIPGPPAGPPPPEGAGPNFNIIKGTSAGEVLEGTDGNDRIRAKGGDDTLVYVLADNTDTEDIYDGGTGSDTLRLVLTEAELGDGGVQADITAYQAFLDTATGGGASEADDSVFSFSEFDLDATHIENLEVAVQVCDTLNVNEDAQDSALGVLVPGAVDTGAGEFLITITALPDSGTVTKAGGAAVAETDTLTQGEFEALEYDTSADFNGDGGRLEYTITDGTITILGKVDFTVAAVNDAPTVSATATQTVTEDVATALSVSIGDIDVGTGTLDVTLSVGAGTLDVDETAGASVTNDQTSTVMLSGTLAQINAALSALEYTTAQDSTASQALTITVDDNGNSGSGGVQTTTDTVTIAVAGVNDAPTISATATQTVTEDVATALSVSIGDVDVGTGTLDVTLAVAAGTLDVDETAGATVGGDETGSVTLNGTLAQINAALSALEYTTAQDSTASQALTITVDDNGNSGSGGTQTTTATVALAVTAVNDAPTVSATTTTTVTEDVATAVAGISIGDVDSGTGDLTVTLSVTGGGTLTVDDSVGSGLTAGDIANNGSSLVTLTGTRDEINTTLAAVAGLVYLTALDDTSAQTLTIGVDDNGNTGSGGAETDTATVTINVTPVNDAPVAVTSEALTGAGVAVSGQLTASDVDDLDSVLNFAAVGADGGAANGDLTVNADGSYTYTPDPGFTGTDSFTFMVSDDDTANDTQTVSVTVDQVFGPVSGSDIAVNTTTTTDQFNPRIVALVGGGFVVVWTDDDGNDSSLDGVYAQVFDSAGVKVGSEIVVNTTTADNQQDPRVLALSNGDFVIAWESTGQDDGGTSGIFAQGIIARQFSVDFGLGTVTGGSEVIVNTTEIEQQVEPKLANLDDGGYVIVWQSFHDAGAGSGDGSRFAVNGQRFSSTGVKVGSEFQVNTTTSGDQEFPDVLGLSGGFVVAWQDDESDGGAIHDIFFRVFETSGTTPTATSAEITVAGTSAVTERNIELGALDSDTFVIAYEDGPNGAADVKFRIYDVTTSTGVVVEVTGGETTANSTTAGDQFRAELAILSYGGFVLVWQDDTQEGAGNDGIFMRIFSNTGAAVTGEIHVNTTTAGDQENPQVTALEGGAFVVTWQSAGQDGSGDGVFARVFLDDGTAISGEFGVNVTTNDDQNFPVVTALDGGGFAIAWESDAQDLSGDGIFAQVFDFGVNLTAGGTNDALAGTQFGDTLNGGGGDDILTGNGGGDNLTGGTGSNIFNYASATDSTLDALDLITDFTDGSDTIDLSFLGKTGTDIAAVLDKGTVAADSFTEVDTADFFNDGGTDRAVAIQDDGSETRVFVDVDGDGNFSVAGDMVIELTGDFTLDTSDFGF